MPPTEIQPVTSNFFLGLRSYTEAQSNSFFGRDAETDTLTGLIELNTLTIVFGRSGTGKTSLLNAGVFPRLRKSYCLPFPIRLKFNTNTDLISQVKTVLKDEINKYGFKVNSYPLLSETLWEYFHKESLWKAITPILVFDQFEEIFTLAKSDFRFALTELPAFWQELSDLIENNIPRKLKQQFLDTEDEIGFTYKRKRAKVVFSFREEYLPEFESITSTIPSLKYSRFRLLPMNGNQAYEVITKTWRENINPSEARHIVTYFTNEQGLDDYNLITVEPSLLSQVCAYIDKERIDSGGGKVSAELLNKYPKEAILRSIYEEAVMQANNSLQRNEPDRNNVIKEFVEEKLITTEGFRTRYHLGAADEPIRPGLNVLATKYFVREDDNVVELTHDVVAPIIKTDREKRRKEIAIAALRKRTRKRAIVLLLITFIAAAATYLYITQKAKADKAKAIADRIEAESKRDMAFKEQQIAETKTRVLQDSITRLDNIIKGKKDLIKKLKDEGIIKEDPPGNYFVDTAALNGMLREIATLTELKKNTEQALLIERDRLNLSLNQKIEELRKIQLDRTSIQADLSVKQKKIDDLNTEIAKLKNDLNSVNSRYDPLRKEIEALKDEIRRNKKTIDSLMKLVGNVNLIGKLYYQNEGNSPVKPSNVPVYLISKKMNRQLAKYNSVYEINCYEKDLNGKKGIFKTVTDANGNYTFRNIPGGEYLLKICTYYGGFYTVKIDPAKRLERNFDASPPVRFPYSN